MSSFANRSVVISVAIMVLALFLTTAGLLHTGFGLKAANQVLDDLMAHIAFRLLLSPVVVLGGPLVTFGLNAWQVFHIQPDSPRARFSVRRAKQALGYQPRFAL